MPTSTGTILYDPKVIVDGHEHFDPWWVVLVCPTELLEQARTRLMAERSIKLSRPRWGAHVSVVAGEVPPEPARWGERDGELVTFSYDGATGTDGRFHWLPIQCDALSEIRTLLGLSAAPAHPFHLTLGRQK